MILDNRKTYTCVILKS